MCIHDLFYNCETLCNTTPVISIYLICYSNITARQLLESHVQTVCKFLPTPQTVEMSLRSRHGGIREGRWGIRGWNVTFSLRQNSVGFGVARTGAVG